MSGLKMLRIGVPAALAGLTGGIALERCYQKNLKRDNENGYSNVSPFSSFGLVEAARPTPSDLPADGGDVSAGHTIGFKASHRTSEISRFGFPSFDSIRSYDNFILSYDRRNRTAAWVMEHMTPSNITGNTVDRSNIEFFQDQSIHPFFRSTNDDYKGSGYDRGHLAAAGNHRADPKLVAQTFVLSNISPQVGKGFNRDAWNKLEKYCRGKARKCDNLYVVTGPLYLPKRDNHDGKLYVKYQVIGKNHVSVPTHFFKVLLAESKGMFELETYVMPNQVIDDKMPLESFLVPIDTIERAAGLIFFERIPRNTFKSINRRKG